MRSVFINKSWLNQINWPFFFIFVILHPFFLYYFYLSFFSFNLRPAFMFVCIKYILKYKRNKGWMKMKKVDFMKLITSGLVCPLYIVCIAPLILFYTLFFFYLTYNKYFFFFFFFISSVIQCHQPTEKNIVLDHHLN